MAKRRDALRFKVYGEFLREASVLVAVFGLLDFVFKLEGAGIEQLVGLAVAFLFVAFLLFRGGLWFEEMRLDFQALGLGDAVDES